LPPLAPSLVRAGVFIGVNRAGTLPKLADAASGAKRMHDWAISQGMVDPASARLITDARGKKITPALIKKAINAILDGPGVEQLVVYFAGHGLNINRNETWLLSGAPEDVDAAVNVSASVDAARYCGIDHVVFISDACRSAPVGLLQQRIQGAVIVPDRETERAKPVDQLYACGLGRTAAEIADREAAVKSYSALYTGVLLDALRGGRGDVLESTEGNTAVLVYTRTLQRFLEAEVPKLVKAKGLQFQVNQNPDSIIVSDRTWLATFAVQQGEVPRIVPPEHPPSLQLELEQAVRDEIRGVGPVFGDPVPSASPVPVVRELHLDADRLRRPFGPDRFESHCGFKVTGATVRDAFAAGAHLDVHDDIVRVWPKGGASTVVLDFGDFGTALPAIPEFLAALRVEDGQLVDVAYEPSANSERWPEFQQKAGEIRNLRAIASAASTQGRFRLFGADADGVAFRMQVAKGLDPSLAIYAAYAYLDLDAPKRVEHMSDILKDDLGLRLFDLELLARKLRGTTVSEHGGLFPLTPMLSQGWALLPAHGVTLPPALDGIAATRRDSVWSTYDPDGVELLRASLHPQ